jgi:hypothetical protein
MNGLASRFGSAVGAAGIALALMPFGASADQAPASLKSGQEFAYKYTTHTTGPGSTRDSGGRITWAVESSTVDTIVLTRVAKGTTSITDRWAIQPDGSYKALSERAPMEAPVPPLTPAANYFGQIPDRPAKGQRWPVNSTTRYLGVGAGDVTITDFSGLPGGGKTMTLELRFESAQSSNLDASVKVDLKTIVDATFDNGILRKWSARARAVVHGPDMRESPALDRTESGERV